MPDFPLYLLQSLFLRLVPAPAHPAESNNVAGIHHSHSSPPLLGPVDLITVPPADQDSPRHVSIGAVQDSSASKPADSQRPATLPITLVLSTPTQTPESSGSDARPLTSQTINFGQTKHRELLAEPQHPQPTAVSSQELPLFQRPTQYPCSPLLDSRERKKGIFYQASNFSLSSAVFIDSSADTTNVNINNSDKFMTELLRETIPGAAFDSSARDPPPRCHPGTRLAILERCAAFIINCSGMKKVRWVFGAAGVGKSAIMQSVTEHLLPSVLLRASIFFSSNGRSDGSKALVTLAYQLAVQCEPYRQFIKQEMAHDPSLLQKSMSAQFSKFIVEPFIHHPQLNCAGRVLIIIDGLDECSQSRIQREFLRLISDFCLTYPLSLLVWMIASRPEPHITSFFAQARVEAAYEKEEIVVDTDEARKDVEIFLRGELKMIQDEFSFHPGAQWPSEPDFWKLAYASGGLFVYAYTAIKYLGDPDIGDPTVQLKEVLQAIDARPLLNVSREEHPMAHLDTLYSQILSKVPTKVRDNMQKLLLTLVFRWDLRCDFEGRNFIVLCNWLGMTSDEAYAALRHLTSVLYVPSHGKAYMEELRCFHKSFLDYISDFSRSGFLADIKSEAQQLSIQCMFRVLEQAPDGIDVGDLNYDIGGLYPAGTLARGPGTGDNILLTWPVDEESGWDDNKTKLYIYKLAFACVMEGIQSRKPLFCSVFFIRLLATRLESFAELPARTVFGFAFDECRQEVMEQGLPQKIPVKVLTTSDIVFTLRLQFRCPITQNSNPFDPWNPSCTHTRSGEWDEGKAQNWYMYFNSDHRRRCDFCFQRLENQLESWKTRFPDYPVSVLFTSAGIGVVEFQFIDPEDGISEWTYLFCHKFEKEERMKLGGTV